MNTLLELLRDKVLVCDGAVGSELMRRGLEPGICPESWNVERREDVMAIHRAYIDAGADMVITNTLGATRWKLGAYGLAERTAEFNAAAAIIAREAVKDKGFVLGDIGPTGRFVAPLGTDPREAFVEVFAEQAKALAGAGVDAIILETFSAVDELLAALEGARTTRVPVIASVSYSPAGSTYRTMMGNEITSVTRELDAAGADVIGANCGVGAEQYPAIAAALCGATRRPVLAEPNAGIPQLIGGETVFPMKPKEFAGYARAIIAAGVRIIGGCCGTTPEHIRAVREIVDNAR